MTSTCGTCGEKYLTVCRVCEMNARKADDVKHTKEAKVLDFIKKYKFSDPMFKTYIDDIASTYLNPTVADVPDAAYPSGSLGSGVGVEPEPEPPTMKVFRIKVWEAGSSLRRGSRAKKMPALYDVIVMLNTDLDAAIDQVSEEYDPNVYDLEGSEITGPFAPGFVLSNWNG